jgi:hypothetical protein
MTRRLIWMLVVAVLAASIFRLGLNRGYYRDFAVYQTAGQRILNAEPLYRAEDAGFQLKYLPVFALAMTPFAHVEPDVAKAIWFSFTFVLVIVFVRQSIQMLPDRRRSVRVLAWITALLIGKFVARELVNGQTNALFGWLLLSSVAALQVRRPVVAGVLVALAIVAKPYAVIVLPWLFWMYGLGPVAAAGVTLVVGLILPAALYGWTGNLQLLMAWFNTATHPATDTLTVGWNISINAMWAKWIGIGRTAAALTALTSVVLLGAAAWIVRQRRRIGGSDYLDLACLLLLIPLVSPHGWDYVLLAAVPAFVLLVDRWGDLSPGWRAVLVGAFALTSFTLFDLLGRRIYEQILDWSLQTLAVIALVAVLAHMRWRSLA